MNLSHLAYAIGMSCLRVSLILSIAMIGLPCLIPDYSGSSDNTIGIKIRNNSHIHPPLLIPSIQKIKGRWNEGQTYRSKVEYITQRLVKASGNKYLNVKIKIDDKASGGIACADKLTNTISVSPLVLSVIRSDDELAGVLAHEMGHLLYNPLSFHHVFFDNKNIPDGETQADLVGINLLAKAGYNPSGILILFQTIQHEIDEDQDNLDDKDHPLMSKRISLISDFLQIYYPTYSNKIVYQNESLYELAIRQTNKIKELVSKVQELQSNIDDLTIKLQNPKSYYSSQKDYEKDYNNYQELIKQLRALRESGENEINKSLKLNDLIDHMADS